MTGRLIAIVGPSGVGKDSVMHALAARDPRFVLARRVITRPADAGGEVFDSVAPAAFESRRAAGEFALDWQAHGLSYGIPAEVDAALASGRDVLANLSRSVLGVARARFTRLEVIVLTADASVLAARLAARGREDAPAIARRLDRASFPVPAGLDLHVVDNGGPIARTVDDILARLDGVSP